MAALAAIPFIGKALGAQRDSIVDERKERILKQMIQQGLHQQEQYMLRHDPQGIQQLAASINRRIEPQSCRLSLLECEDDGRRIVRGFVVPTDETLFYSGFALNLRHPRSLNSNAYRAMIYEQVWYQTRKAVESVENARRTGTVRG